MNPQSISIIVPVLHEESTIHEWVEGLLKVLPHNDSSHPLEIIVVDGDPEGSTVGALAEYSSTSSDRPAFRTVISPRPGRGTQLNNGALIASGNIFLFLHADTILPIHAIKSIQATLEETEVMGGAFSLGVASSHWGIRMIACLTTLRSRLTRIPYGDQAIFLRREVFERLGGFREIPIMEDLDIMRRCRKAGHRIRILRDRVSSSPRRWEREGLLKCTCRNWWIRTAFLLGVSPEKLVRTYRPHGDPVSPSQPPPPSTSPSSPSTSLPSPSTSPPSGQSSSSHSSPSIDSPPPKLPLR
jgi:uncharacterized protein